MFTARRCGQRLDEHRIFQPEIQIARAGNLHLFANIRDIQLRHHICSKLARIHFAFLGEGHERIGLIVAKFRIGTRPDENRGDISIRQYALNGGLQGGFNFFVRQHEENLTAKYAKDTKNR